MQPASTVTIVRWLRPALALALGLPLAAIGCVLEPDVVAQPEPDRAPEADAGVVAPPGATLDAGKVQAPPDGGAADVSAPAPPALCTSAFDGVMLATAEGRLYGYDLQLRRERDHGVPSCLQDGRAQSAALDGQGATWVSSSDGSLYNVAPGSLSCSALPLVVELSAMAFVHNALTSRLYALEAGRLIAIDPSSLEIEVVGALDATQLAADPFGSLFAIRQDERTVQIGRVDLPGPRVVPLWQAWFPEGDLTGVAALDQNALWLFSSTYLYQFDRHSEETRVVGPIGAEELGLVMVAAASCVPQN